MEVYDRLGALHASIRVCNVPFLVVPDELGAGQTLTLRQEAILDAIAYPWTADVWQIALLVKAKATASSAKLGSRRSSKALAAAQADAQRSASPDDVPDLSIHIPVLKGMSLLPHSSALDLLMQPLLARGAGLRLKCAAFF